MRTLLLSILVLTGFTSWAADKRLQLRDVLKDSNCGNVSQPAPAATAGDDGTAGGSKDGVKDTIDVAGKTCGQVTYTFCAKNPSDPGCGSAMKGKRPNGKPSPGSLDINASNVQQMLDKAKQLADKGPDEDGLQAQRCCGGNVSGCVAQDSDAFKASESISNANADAKKDKDTGLKDKCAVYRQQTENASTMSSGVAGACKAYRSMCMRGYRSLKGQLEEKARGASGDDQTALTSAASDYENKAAQCEALSAEGIDSNALAMAGDSALGQECAKKADDGTGTGGGKGDGKGSTQPQSTAGGDPTKNGSGSGSSSGGGAGGMGKDLGGALGQLAQLFTNKDDKSSKDDAAAATPDCSNPATAGCYQAASTNSWNGSAAAGGASAASSNPSGSIDVADTSGANTQNPFAPSTVGTAAPISVQSVPGGGGGMGGMGGGGGANLGNSGAGGGGGGGPKANTDVLHGEGGGGGGGLGAMNAGMSTATGGAGGGYTYGKGAKADAGDSVDWRQFLPGGAKDPTRKLASVNSARTEIQPATTNIFNRISERIRARCAQGLLRDCN